MQPFPELEPHCGSWVITNLRTGRVFFETFDRETAEKLHAGPGFRVETAAQYLARINTEVTQS